MATLAVLDCVSPEEGPLFSVFLTLCVFWFVVGYDVNDDVLRMLIHCKWGGLI